MNDTTTVQRITDHELAAKLDENFTRYAFTTLEDRALPDARDGLKPSQRRVLVAMNDLKLAPNGSTKKNAKICGDCFVAGTLVTTKRGLIAVENVEVGDEVVTQQGLKKVSQAYYLPPKPVMTVEFENGLRVSCTKSQRFKILNENFEYEWKEAVNLRDSDYVVFLPNQIAEVGSEADENECYFQGLLFSDGYIARDAAQPCRYGVALACSSLECVEWFKSYAVDCIGESRAEIRMVRDGFWAYRNRTNKASDWVQTQELTGKYANSLVVPEKARRWKNCLMHLLGGFVDGDGHVRSNRNELKISSICESFLREIQIGLLNCGIVTSLTNRGVSEGLINGRMVKSRADCWELGAYGVHARTLYERLPLRHKMKSERAAAAAHDVTSSKWDLIPYLSRHVLCEFAKKHLGGGWYLVGDKKIRVGLKYADGTKFRYSRDRLEFRISNKLVGPFNLNVICRCFSCLRNFTHSEECFISA